MSITRRIAICKNEKDTKKFLELLESVNSPFYIINGTLTSKRNCILHYRNLLGMEVSEDIKIPFNFPMEHQLENPDLYYYEDEFNDKDTVERVEKALENPKPWFDVEDEIFLDKNRTLICLSGERASLQSGYSLMTFDRIAGDRIAKLSSNLDNLSEFLTDGKIDLAKAMPHFIEEVANEIIDENSKRILKEVILFDLDGMDDPDRLFTDGSLFKMKTLKPIYNINF